MRIQTKRALKKRFYGYVIKYNDANELVRQITDDVELIVMDKDKYIQKLEKSLSTFSKKKKY